MSLNKNQMYNENSGLGIQAEMLWTKFSKYCQWESEMNEEWNTMKEVELRNTLGLFALGRWVIDVEEEMEVVMGTWGIHLM